MNYGCTVGASNPTQVELVREQCRNSNACRIEASREIFGNSVCPGTDDAQMTLSMSYTCNKGGGDKSSVHMPICKLPPYLALQNWGESNNMSFLSPNKLPHVACRGGGCHPCRRKQNNKNKPLWLIHNYLSDTGQWTVSNTILVTSM